MRSLVPAAQGPNTISSAGGDARSPGTAAILAARRRISNSWIGLEARVLAVRRLLLFHGTWCENGYPSDAWDG
jgi:hypothetical protein